MKTEKGAETRFGGRPLGLMQLWLERSGAASTKETHCSREVLRSYTLADRQAARMRLMSTAAGKHLAEFERALLEGEPEEPQTLEGLV